MKLYHLKNIKYMVHQQWEWKLVGDMEPKSEYECRWYALKKKEDGWYIIAYPGCVWDGATMFIDFEWIRQGSLGHDILLWLVALGIIDESKNDLIDHELEHIINARAKVPKFGGKSLLKFRAWYSKTGTHLAQTKNGEKIHEVFVV